MFAKTLALLGIATVLAVIPTAAADHVTEGCGALLGHDAVLFVDLNGLDDCLGATPLAPQPLPGQPDQAGPSPPAMPGLIADCVAVEPWSSLCAAVNELTAPVPEDEACAVPIGDRCLVASPLDPATSSPLADLPAFERPPVDLAVLGSLFEPTPEAPLDLGVAAPAPCVAVYPYSGLCTVLP